MDSYENLMDIAIRICDTSARDVFRMRLAEQSLNAIDGLSFIVKDSLDNARDALADSYGLLELRTLSLAPKIIL
jgi:hypothetical protein